MPAERVLWPCGPAMQLKGLLRPVMPAKHHTRRHAASRMKLTDPRLETFSPLHVHDRSKTAIQQQIGRHDHLLLLLNSLICPDDVWKLPAKIVNLRVNST